MSIDYKALFHHIHPDFFEQESIRSLPAEYIFDEMLLELRSFSPQEITIPVPEGVTFGIYSGDIAALHDSIREVDPDWVQYFNPGDPVFCAFDGQRVVSFCMLDDFGEYQGMKIGAPGCVGTIPSYRKKGVGLKMVQLATACLKEQGYDWSYIHHTHVAHWYARLGYRTILRWNSAGLL